MNKPRQGIAVALATTNRTPDKHSSQTMPPPRSGASSARCTPPRNETVSSSVGVGTGAVGLSAGTAGAGAGDVTTAGSPQYSTTPQVTCSRAGMLVVVTHQGGLARVQLTSEITPPSRMDLTIAKDGDVLVLESFHLVYDVYRPNGPECTPQCRSTSVVAQVGSAG